MNIKGKCRIELKDKKTGKVERHEEHNMITEFSQELFKQMGYLRPNAFANRETLPIDDLFGGIMCFDTAITEATDMTGRHSSPLYPPADKEMVANASMAITGNTAPEELGQYNSRSSTSTATSRKFIFDWDTDEGLGQIASVCLTSKYGGYKGVGNSYDGLQDTSIEVVEPMEATNIYDGGGQTYFDTNSRIAYINRSNNIIGVISGLDFASGTLVVKEYDLAGVGINPFKNLRNGDMTGAREVATHNLTFTALTDAVAEWYVVCRYGHWFIVACSKNPNASDNVVNVIKFNADNTQEQYRFTGLQLGYMYSPATSRFDFAFLGNYFITACVNVGSYQSYNYVNAVHTGTYEVTRLGTLSITASNQVGPDAVLEGRMYIGGTYIVRLKNGTPVLERCNSGGGTGYGHDGWICYGQFIDDPYVLFITTSNYDLNQFRTRVQGTLFKPYLATIFNLDSPVQKLGDKTLKVTYELTLVTS